MSARLQSLLLFLVYTFTILGVLVWSGGVTERTLYDRFIVNLEGVIVPAGEQNNQLNFYRSILDFAQWPISRKTTEATDVFMLPGKKKIIIESSNAIPGPAPLIRVRNGFEKLHKELIKRTGKPEDEVFPARPLPHAAVSKIYNGRFGKQFAVSDPQGNILLFYKSEKKLFKKRT